MDAYNAYCTTLIDCLWRDVVDADNIYRQTKGVRGESSAFGFQWVTKPLDSPIALWVKRFGQRIGTKSSELMTYLS